VSDGRPWRGERKARLHVAVAEVEKVTISDVMRTAGAYTHSLAGGAASDGTHEKGGQYDCEHNFTSIPERICWEDEDRLCRLRESLGQPKTTNCSTPTL
jgi:hypothetical protein